MYEIYYYVIKHSGYAVPLAHLPHFSYHLLK